MIHPVPVRGPASAALVHRVLVIAHGLNRLLAAEAACDERHPYDLLAVRVVKACEPSPCVPAEIARALLCRRQASSLLVDRLVREGLVAAAPVSDRRCRGIRLTAQGRDLVVDADERLATVGATAFGPLTAEARTTLLATLRCLDLVVREAICEHEMRWGTDYRSRPPLRKQDIRAPAPEPTLQLTGDRALWSDPWFPGTDLDRSCS
jgi:DNA-binding MarR family transcriptional regulator